MQAQIEKFYFPASDDGVWFEFHPKPPQESVVVKLGRDLYRVNPTALRQTFLYRCVVEGKYSRLNLSEDIKKWKPPYEAIGNKANNPLHNYAVDACVGATQEWLSQENNTQCIIACQQTDSGPRMVGFIHFFETTYDDKNIVYLAQSGVTKQRHKLGTRLAQLVMSRYPAGTEFHLLTRIFNRETYASIRGFVELDQEAISARGYDPERYCGFTCTSNDKLLREIHDNVKQIDDDEIPSLKPAEGKQYIGF